MGLLRGSSIKCLKQKSGGSPKPSWNLAEALRKPRRSLAEAADASPKARRSLAETSSKPRRSPLKPRRHLLAHRNLAETSPKPRQDFAETLNFAETSPKTFFFMCESWLGICFTQPCLLCLGRHRLVSWSLVSCKIDSR